MLINGNKTFIDKELEQILSDEFALFEKEELKYSLNDPSLGLLVPEMTWRSLNNFSSGAVCCVMASDYYLESDYIRDFDEFLGSFH